MINVIAPGEQAVRAPFSKCSLLRVQQFEANWRCRLAVWADEPNPPIGYAVLRAEKFMDSWMGTWYLLGAVAMCFSATLDLHDGMSFEVVHPARVSAMHPRDLAVINDPETSLKPPAVWFLGPQGDHLSSDLDQRPVSKHVRHAKANDGSERDCQRSHR